MGTAYQALFNFAFARRQGGKFVLRIEDTDRVRSRPESEKAILDSLRWVGLLWDEGPDVGGPHGPYRQSERTEIYREYAGRLLDQAHGYRCFCTPERLEQLRRESGPGYDRHCRDLDPKDSIRRVGSGEPFVVRMKVPLEGVCVMKDLLRGEISREWALVDDQVILKSDGYPTYHLANVIDDHLMEISHVIRGEEWINSVPKHLKLYEYFEWEPPVFCHLPLLRNKDKSKLSKRKNPTSIQYYRKAGYLPEALLNFLGMMGWTMPGGEEKFSLQEMVEHFDLERISLGGPVFDQDKLRWLNGRYIRENLDAQGLYAALETWAVNKERIQKIIPLVQPRLETLADWGGLTMAFFSDQVSLDAGDLELKGKSPEEVADLLQLSLWRLEDLPDFSSPALSEVFKELGKRFEMKLRDLTVVFYAALSGSRVWTPLYESMEVLGPDLVRSRLRRAIELLGGGSAKRQKKLEKRYSELFGGGS